MRKRFWLDEIDLFRGFEGDGDDDPDGGTGDGTDGTDGTDGGSGDSGDLDDATGGDKPDTATLTIRKERQARKAAEKRLKELEEFKKGIDDRDKSDLDKEREARTAAEQATTALHQEIIDTRIENAVTALATKFKFRDIDDALRLIDREAIEVDAEKRTVDKGSVEKALKALAEAKPHLILGEGEAPPASGSKFGGATKDKGKTTEEALKKKYPALNQT